MNRNDPDTLDLLAAEFVLGTLGGAARRRFDRARQADPFVERRVLAWEERLAGLTFRLDPVTPSPAVWPSIERRIGAAPARRRCGLMAAAAAVAAAAALGLGWFLWQESRVAPPQAEALFANEAGLSIWRVELAADGRTVEVSTIGAIEIPERRSRELWALPPESAPVSLGLMPARGRTRLVLDERQQAAIALAPNVAVSDEPFGGSPTGAPTGAVLHVAAIARS
jgi:anti-sigma-K factor RskA